jgi:hypothetical protein
MSAIDERKALERLSLSYRKLIVGAKASPPATPPETTPATTETPVLPAQAAPGVPSSPAV